MKPRNSRGCGDTGCTADHGPSPFAVHLPREAQQNLSFRRALWTGKHLQMTLMSIPVCGEIGVEMHPDTDQLLRVEAGQALVCLGSSRESLQLQRHLQTGEAVFVPCGTWHNVQNAGNGPLKLSSLYAPPNHPWGTLQPTRADAEKSGE